MAYSKTTWVNNSTPNLNADNLNKLEAGVEAANNFADTATDVGKSVLTAKDAAAARVSIAVDRVKQAAKETQIFAEDGKGYVYIGTSDVGWYDGKNTPVSFLKSNYTLPSATTTVLGGVHQAAALADLAADADLAAVITAFNTLLANLRAAGSQAEK